MNIILLQVDYYKDTGKWYAGGIVNIQYENIFDITKQIINEKQQIVGHPADFHMVAKNANTDSDVFFDRLYVRYQS